jgi:hypothetical protein
MATLGPVVIVGSKGFIYLYLIIYHMYRTVQYIIQSVAKDLTAFQAMLGIWIRSHIRMFWASRIRIH